MTALTFVFYIMSVWILGFKSWMVKILGLGYVFLWGVLLFEVWKGKENKNEIFDPPKLNLNLTCSLDILSSYQT